MYQHVQRMAFWSHHAKCALLVFGKLAYHVHIMTTDTWSTKVCYSIWTQIHGLIVHDYTVTSGNYLHLKQNTVHYRIRTCIKLYTAVWYACWTCIQSVGYFNMICSPSIKHETSMCIWTTSWLIRSTDYYVCWPDRLASTSTVLPQMDLCFWWYIRAQIWCSWIYFLADLTQCIYLTCQKVNPCVLQHIQYSVLFRIWLCFVFNGEHLQQYL